MTKRANWGKTPWKVRFRGSRRALPGRADFVVIGGGFTGLSAAAALARLSPEKSVLLLEAERLGNGASGRTGGIALAQSAAGDLPGLGDVLKGYRRILRQLGVPADLTLPGVWELARGEQSMEGKAVHAMKNSPIDWEDSGRTRAVGQVAGGTVDPGKVVAGLARAAARAGAQIVEEARVLGIEMSHPVRLAVRYKRKGRTAEGKIDAGHVLVATNAGSLELGGEIFAAQESAEAKLTFAIATAHLSNKQLAAIGMASGRPFYTVDLPYLWGRRMKNGGMIFGSGLVPGWGESVRDDEDSSKERKLWSGLEGIDGGKGEAAERLHSLEKRVRALHPALKTIKVTHRWCGPILITKHFVPVFRRHPQNKNVLVLGGYSGHGVAQSVYLGRWAAEHLTGKRELPDWQ